MKDGENQFQAKINQQYPYCVRMDECRLLLFRRSTPCNHTPEFGVSSVPSAFARVGRVSKRSIADVSNYLRMTCNDQSGGGACDDEGDGGRTSAASDALTVEKGKVCWICVITSKLVTNNLNEGEKER